MLTFLVTDRDLNESIAVITGENLEEIQSKCATACADHFASEGSIIGLENLKEHCTFFTFKGSEGFKHSLKLKPIVIY